MAVKTVVQDKFICDTEAEKNDTWPEGSNILCKDTNNEYTLETGQFRMINTNKILFVQTNHVTVENTTVASTLIGTDPDGKTTNLSANFWYPGRVIRAKMRGGVSETGTPTLSINVSLGATVLLESGAMSLSGEVSNDYWSLDLEITCRTAGATGTLMVEAVFDYDNSDQSGKKKGLIPDSIQTITYDTTQAGALDITAQWSVADVGNSITSALFNLESLN